MNRPKLLQNAFLVPSIGKFYCSWSTHDFVGHKFVDGRSYYVDGGLSYQRAIGDFGLIDDASIEDYTLFDTDPIDKIRDKLVLFDFFKKDEVSYVRIKDFSTENLKKLSKVLEKPTKFLPIVKEVVDYWLEQREKPQTLSFGPNLFIGFDSMDYKNDNHRGTVFFKSIPLVRVWKNHAYSDAKHKNISEKWEVNRDSLALKFNFPDDAPRFDSPMEILEYCENWTKSNLEGKV